MSFTQKQQELFEGIVAVIAVVILTSMVFWMRRVARNIKRELEHAVDEALHKSAGGGLALVMMVFLAVAREGLESVFFLLAAFTQDVGYAPPLGAVLGLATAVVLGMLIYWGGLRLNAWRTFSAGPACSFCWWQRAWQGAIRAFHEAGLWNHFQQVAFDMSPILSTHSLFGTVLEGMLGYQEAPSVSEVAVWLLYLIPALLLFVMPARADTSAAAR